METYAKGASPMEIRDRICRSKGILGGFRTAHNIIARSVTDPQKLLQKGLDAETLKSLGYTLEGMKAIGYSTRTLITLGYIQKPNTDSNRVSAQDSKTPGLQELIRGGADSNRLQSAGFTLQHCKSAGLDAREVAALGFELPQLVQVYNPSELRQAGYGIQDLRGHFQGPDLRSAGFTPRDFKNAGFTIRDLLNFGFSENHVRVAGYSNNDLSHEGLMRQTVDRVRGFA